MTAAADPSWRPSIEKPPVVVPPFERLPDEIIEQIYQATDPNGFASLVLLNRTWRRVSQQAHLYLHHLAQCPSFAASHPTILAADNDRLPQLRHAFAREVKRNLFEAYLRPSETVIKIVSNSISSSSAPGGEGLQFSPSPKGHHILAYNSSRIYVIDVRGPSLDVKRELKILRRPASACIKDDGAVLAVLSSEMQVDLYDLTKSPPQRKQSIILDHSPRTIALSPCGSVLAAAYEGGIEVSSLGPGALATDRRAVKCDAVDALAFSSDGTQILGTTIQSLPPNTVILTAPYYDPGSQLMEDNVSSMWTTSILFPNTSRDCSHAVLLQDGNEEEASWTFTYDRSFETFRAVRIDDLRNGTTYFTGPIPNTPSLTKLVPSTLPAATYNGELVSAGFQGKEIWIYGVPEDLDAVPDPPPSSNDSGSGQTSLGRRNSSQSSVSRHASTRGQEAAGGRVPQWQVLCDKLRNTFVSGVKVSELTGVSNVKWVAGFGNASTKERLIVAARGISESKKITEEEDMDFEDGGRVTLLDFDYGLYDGIKKEIIIEVGTNNAEVLEEEKRDMETEVAIVRRRTVAQRRGNRTALLRAATTAARNPEVPPVPQSETTDDDPLVPRIIGQRPGTRPMTAVENPEDGDAASIDEQEALDAPYAHASPRSGMTLRRAATAAAVNRTLNPRTADGRPIAYRRADGRREHPHESDADGWVPPPPPYQADDPVDLPAFLRVPAVAPAVASAQAVSSQSASMDQKPERRRANPTSTVPEAVQFHETPQGLATASSPPTHHRTTSDSDTVSRPHIEEARRPVTSQAAYMDTDNLYDVSPPDSPQGLPLRPAVSHPSPSETRQPSGSTILPLTESRPETSHTGVDPQLMTSIVRSGMPTLDLHIPPPDMLPVQSQAAPRIRALSNAQTWPAGPQPGDGQAGAQLTGYPLSAPPAQATVHDLEATGPTPLPTSNQMASLSNRISQGHPGRLSGGFQVQRVPVGGRREQRMSSQEQPNVSFAGTSSRATSEEPDMPLIISTPKGVSGAFDPPQRQTSERRGDTPIYAPVPRHPRPSHHGFSPRPTVERLETIYSVTTGPGDQQQTQSVQHGGLNATPTWLTTPSRTSSGRGSHVANRQSSRAERSAAKNMADARKKAWDKKMNKKSKKKKKQYDTASSTGWTDISGVTAFREKKCTVM